MNQYELSYLISPDLPDEEVAVFCEKINSLIQDKGAVLGKISAEKKISLGYPIKKKVTAFIKTVSFHLSPEKLLDLEKSLQEKEEILRHFIITPKEIKKHIKKELVFKTSDKEVESETKESEETQAEAQTKKETEESHEEKTKEKVELKDIDKKLKEIFDE